MNPFSVWPRCLHPGRLTWNLQITNLERKMILNQTSMIIMFQPITPSRGCNFLHLPKNQWCTNSLPIVSVGFSKDSRGFTSSSPRCLSKATLLASPSSTSWALRATLRCTSCGRQRLGMQDMSKNWRFFPDFVGKMICKLSG